MPTGGDILLANCSRAFQEDSRGRKTKHIHELFVFGDHFLLSTWLDS